MRQCRKCGESKLLAEFSICDGYYSHRCKTGSNAYHRSIYKLKDRIRNHRYEKYKLTEDQFQEFLKIQNNRCAICKEEFIKTPQVDHNHQTGKVRNLLCNLCNKGLGLFRDNSRLLYVAAGYLDEHNDKQEAT